MPRLPRPSPSRFALLLPLLLPLGALGCDADPCGPELWEACDIRDAECQRRIFDAVRCDRGYVTGGMPAVRVIDREMFRAELVESTSERTPLPHHDATMQLLDLSPEDATGTETAIDVAVASIVAFYRLEEQDITIVDRGAPMDLLDDAEVLAHEMVHVVQDRAHGIAGLYDGAETVDEAFAMSSVVEGDATFHQILYRARAEGHDIDALRWDSFYASWLQRSMDGLYAETARYHVANRSFPYVLGARRLTTRWLMSPAFATDELWMDPPRSSFELMFDPSTHEPPPGVPMPVRCGPPSAPAGLEMVDEDSLGAITVFAFLGSSELAPLEGWRLARTVIGDQIVAFGDATGTVTAFQWRIRVLQAVNAVAIEAAMRDWASRAGVLVSLDGVEVVIAGATDPAVLAAWPDGSAPCRVTP